MYRVPAPVAGQLPAGFHTSASVAVSWAPVSGGYASASVPTVSSGFCVAQGALAMVAERPQVLAPQQHPQQWQALRQRQAQPVLIGPGSPVYQQGVALPNVVRGRSAVFTTAPCEQTVQPSTQAATSVPAKLMELDHFMRQPMVQSVQERFGRLLALLEEKEVFQRLQPSADGVLHVSVPFCGAFFEAPVLANFLRRFVQSRADITKVRVLCSDVVPNSARVAFSAFDTNDAIVDMRFEAIDLGQHQLPPADFVLGLQPEVTNSATLQIWRAIIGSCAKAAPVAVFTTLARNEAEQVQRHCNGIAVAEISDGLTKDTQLDAYDGMRYCNIVLVKRTA